MDREADGHFSVVDEERARGRYWFRLDGERLRPDPASRHQPEGPHEPSAYVDPAAFAWTDKDRIGLHGVGLVVYEMHVGTFTPEGTWAAAAAQLDELARIGIKVIEMMPIAAFPGRFGWGYDGVDLPPRIYGTPDDLQAFIDRAHKADLGVILDVVYNHLGPAGNYLNELSADYFTDKHTTDWGRAINFEGPEPVRQLFVQNAGYWIDEYHFDGLRLDATQNIKDESSRHIMADMIASARAAARRQPIFIVAENEPQDTMLVRPPDRGGYGVDALERRCAPCRDRGADGRREAYHRLHGLRAGHLVRAFRVSVSGEAVRGRKGPGTPALDLRPHRFVASGESRSCRQLRVRTTPARVVLAGPAPGHDGVVAAGSCDTDALPGQEFPPRSRSSISRTTSRSWPTP
jgi:maltooligosyltrehalose trehalohydrolase